MLARTAFFDFDMFRIREILLGVCITLALWLPSMNEKLFSNNTQIQFHSLVALGNQYADTNNHCIRDSDLHNALSHQASRRCHLSNDNHCSRNKLDETLYRNTGT